MIKIAKSPRLLSLNNILTVNKMLKFLNHSKHFTIERELLIRMKEKGLMLLI